MLPRLRSRYVLSRYVILLLRNSSTNYIIPVTVFVCFSSISLIFLAINSTVISAVSSFGVNCSSRLKMLSEYISLKKCAIVASVCTAWRPSALYGKVYYNTCIKSIERYA